MVSDHVHLSKSSFVNSFDFFSGDKYIDIRTVGSSDIRYITVQNLFNIG